MSPAWPLNGFWKTLQSVSVSYPYLVPQICPQLGIVPATVILLCSPLIWRAPSIIISRPFWCNVACSLSFLKTERLLNYPFIFLQIFCSVSQALSGLSFLPCLLTFHSISPVLRDILVHHAVLQNKLLACCVFEICITTQTDMLLNFVPSGQLWKLGNNMLQILYVGSRVYQDKPYT